MRGAEVPGQGPGNPRWGGPILGEPRVAVSGSLVSTTVLAARLDGSLLDGAVAALMAIVVEEN